MGNKNAVKKCCSIFVTIVIVYIAIAGFIGGALAEESVYVDAENQNTTEQAVEGEMVSIQTGYSASTYTGCLTTKSRWNLPKGVVYYVLAGKAPAGKCLSGDRKVSFASAAYVNKLEARLANLESLLANVTRSGNDIYIDKANVHIMDGSGDTDGPVNGLGNLIIGYNEKKYTYTPDNPTDNRTGSHNLILGARNNYMSYGGLVAGENNEISGPFATISGGTNNIASGISSSVSGGHFNEASGNASSVSGGSANDASGEISSVSGGSANDASGERSSVSGGTLNKAIGKSSSVSGGAKNHASSEHSSISGGYGSIAIGRFSSVSGGNQNTASGISSSVSGGHFNEASGEDSLVSGGNNRSAPGEYDWVAGDLFQDE